jgi:hypothetical protein
VPVLNNLSVATATAAATATTTTTATAAATTTATAAATTTATAAAQVFIDDGFHTPPHSIETHINTPPSPISVHHHAAVMHFPNAVADDGAASPITSFLSHSPTPPQKYMSSPESDSKSPKGDKSGNDEHELNAEKKPVARSLRVDFDLAGDDDYSNTSSSISNANGYFWYRRPDNDDSSDSDSDNNGNGPDNNSLPESVF